MFSMKWGATPPTPPDRRDPEACRRWNEGRDAALALLPVMRAEVVKADAFGRKATPKEIIGMLELMFSRYYTPDRDPATERALMREWLEDLRGISIGRLKACMRAWRAKDTDFAPRAAGPLLAMSEACNGHKITRMREAIANIEASEAVTPMSPEELEDHAAEVALAEARREAELRREREARNAEWERMEAEAREVRRKGIRSEIRSYTAALADAEANGEELEATLLRASIVSAQNALEGLAA